MTIGADSYLDSNLNSASQRRLLGQDIGHDFPVDIG